MPWHLTTMLYYAHVKKYVLWRGDKTSFSLIVAIRYYFLLEYDSWQNNGILPNLYVFCVALPIIGTDSSNEYWIILKTANSGTIYFFPHISFPSVTPSSTLKAEAGGSTLTPIYKAIMGTIPFWFETFDWLASMYISAPCWRRIPEVEIHHALWTVWLLSDENILLYDQWSITLFEQKIFHNLVWVFEIFSFPASLALFKYKCDTYV